MHRAFIPLITAALAALAACSESVGPTAPSLDLVAADGAEIQTQCTQAPLAVAIAMRVLAELRASGYQIDGEATALVVSLVRDLTGPDGSFTVGGNTYTRCDPNYQSAVIGLVVGLLV